MGSQLKLAMIGLDTSHCAAFANLLNNDRDRHHVPGARVEKAFRDCALRPKTEP